MALLSAPAAASAAGLRTGCDSARPAVAYHPGGAALARQPTSRPVPCLAVVDSRTSESATIAMTSSGRLLYAPLVDNDYPAPLDDRGPALIAASDDGGTSWQKIAPGQPDHILDVPPWMARDPQTGRIWFASVLPDLCGTSISWSDDDGRTWDTNPAVGCPAMGSLSIIEGPAPAGGARPAGYAHVVYDCANANDLSNSNLWCYRSLDGGKSFSFAGSFPDPLPTADCQAKHPARPGTVGPDGVLYFPVYTCGQLSIAISRDEGATWELVPIAKSDVQDLYITSTAADANGNLYLAWIEGSGSSSDGIPGRGRPTLSISRDHGRSWSKPVSLQPPGTQAARHIAIATTGVGKLAVSFLASTTDTTKLSGYLTETADALAAHPVWLAAALNDPATPLISASDSESFGDRLFFFTDTFSPGGEPWAAFHCAKTAVCPGRRIGVVGRLAAPAKRP
ncbi:MAG: hypothetical protein ACJ76Z_14240 [Thermoleophilaceae bacterium]